jgi:hypothetical protein
MRVILRLLEAEQYALAALHEEENAESGLAKCREAWQARESASAAFASVIPYEYKTDQHGKPLPVPLEEGLSVLMPGLKKDPKAQLERFLQWLSDNPVWQLRIEIEALKRQADDERLENRARVEAFGLFVAKGRLSSSLVLSQRRLMRLAFSSLMKEIVLDESSKAKPASRGARCASERRRGFAASSG